MIANGGQQMQIVLNGEIRDVPEGLTVEALVLTLADDPRGVAIERNLEIVPKAEHERTVLQDGDR
ncbi:MAG: sulfur carrier protein ThiS, partial [Pseudomonadota bacterium]